MKKIEDQIGRKITLPDRPTRIVSLVPSQTELLYDLGVWDQVAGVTRFCLHPSEARKTKEVIGGTKDPKIEQIKQLQPDLVIANKEENRKEDIELLEQAVPVWVSDVHDLASALEMIRSVGQLVGAGQKADELATQIQEAFDQISTHAAQTALYLIWRKPWMAAGKGTFIDDMMDRCGFENVLSQTRYPEISDADMAALQPDRILLSSEPFPFGKKQIAEVQALCPDAQVQLVDGELFSWYGSRLKQSATYFERLISKPTSTTPSL